MGPRAADFAAAFHNADFPRPLSFHRFASDPVTELSQWCKSLICKQNVLRKNAAI
jgi:hypothetical protein